MNLKLPLVDPLTSDSEAFLKKVQGNTIWAHGRELSRLLFVHSDFDDPAKLRSALLECVRDGDLLTSAHDEMQPSKSRRKRDRGAFSSVAISRAGYEKLGAQSLAPMDYGRFRSMRDAPSSSYENWGSDFHETWNDLYRETVIHFLVQLADDDDRRLRERTRDVRDRIESDLNAKVLTEEGRRRIHSTVDKDSPIEHFGFRDGISNPKFTVRKSESNRTQYWPRWSDATPLDRLFVEESNGSHNSRSYGSYIAFMKLEQDVRGFQSATKELATRLGIPWDPDRAGALAVGRWRDGTPIVRQRGDALNDFNFDGKNSGDCPFHAHIRVMNRRRSGHQIARRSSHYGARPDLDKGSEAELPNDGVGLLFLSYQSAIDAFQRAMRSAKRPNVGEGLDPVMGRAVAEGRDGTQTWPARSYDIVTGEIALERFRMADFVKILGGEFFFAPSIPFFEKLAKL